VFVCGVGRDVEEDNDVEVFDESVEAGERDAERKGEVDEGDGEKEEGEEEEPETKSTGEKDRGASEEEGEKRGGGGEVREGDGEGNGESLIEIFGVNPEEGESTEREGTAGTLSNEMRGD
jgi:hypothetical protein